MRAAVVVLAAALCGCSGRAGATNHPFDAPVEMVATPKWALAACATVAALRRFCPGEVPLTRNRGWTMIVSAPRRNYPIALFQLQSGVAWGGFAERVHRPPILGSTVVLGGAFLRLDAGAFPNRGTSTVALRNGLANGLRRRPIALGTRTWSGLHGELSLTPSVYAAQGELTDVVVFRWRDHHGDHAVGVNVWEPLTDAVATLHAIVSTLAAQLAAPLPRTRARVDGIPLTDSPRWLAELCRTPPSLRPACPSRVPAAGRLGAYVDVLPTPRSGTAPATTMSVSVGWGGAYANPRRNRPPLFVHLELTAGRFPHAKHYAPALPLARLTVPTGYAVTLPVALGTREWTPRAGRLVFGDCFGNHLCYRWRAHGRDFQIDLHAWDPVGETVDVLHAIVASTPAGRS